MRVWARPSAFLPRCGSVWRWRPDGALGATVDRDAGTGVITIIDDVDTADDILVDAIRDARHRQPHRRRAGEQRRLRQRPRRTRSSASRGTSIAVDLGEGNDVFNAAGVSSPISVAGGPGNDTIATSVGDDVLAGGEDDDTLDGEAGIDDYFGETGNDVIEARDALAERISCGAGTDEAHNDFVDIIAECERGIDGDGDGFSSAVDCNDGARERLPRRARGVRERRRRELRRPRQPEPRPRRRRLPAAG